MAGGVATQRGPEPAESQTRSPGGPRQLDPDGKLGSGSGIFGAEEMGRCFYGGTLMLVVQLVGRGCILGVREMT